MAARDKIIEKYKGRSPKKDEPVKTPDKPHRELNLQVEYISIDKLNPAPYNPRIQPQEMLNKLAKGITEFGFVDPIIINTYEGRENVVCGGHARIKAARIIGMETVPCVKVCLPEKEEKALNIALNRISGDWHLDQLTDLLRELYESSADLDLTGFTTEEINALLNITTSDQRPDPEDIPTVDTSVAEMGDYWICGNHRLLVGDSTKQEDIARLMAGQLCDMIWTDPPYNVAYEGTAGKIQNDDMSNAAFDEFLTCAFLGAMQHTKAGGCIYVAHAEGGELGYIFVKAFMAAGFMPKQKLVWVKQSAPLSRQDYSWKHEPLLYGWKPGAAHFFNLDFTQTTVIDDEPDIEKMDKRQLIGLIKEMRNRVPESVIRVDRPTKSELHPTTKPVALVERMIIASSQEGEVVLDLFGGSGTTMIASEKNMRRSRIMEYDPKYATVILERFWGYSREEPQLELIDGTLMPYSEVKKLRGKV